MLTTVTATVPSTEPHRLRVVPVGTDPELDLFWGAANDEPFTVAMPEVGGMNFSLSRAGGKDVPIVCSLVMPSGTQVTGSLEYILDLIDSSRAN